MAASNGHRERIHMVLSVFLKSTGRSDVELDDNTNLIGDLGMASDEGVDLVLDLCEEFEFDFPHDFNPVVHPSGRRGRRLKELVDAVGLMLARKAVVS